MSDAAIRVDGLGKRFHVGRSRRTDSLREAVTDAVMAPWRWLRAGRPGRADEVFWALKDVSLEVGQGEVVGVVGRNGAGKSTLLKILSRVTDPTTGTVELAGRVGSLLEVGTGFHPELTGRENVYLNGSVLGMRREEIRRKFDEIVAFAEVEQFIDTPVKHYSSGMAMRLGFAVAAHLENEILLVDEVLAVGDAAFQPKCQAKIADVARGGRTVLFVSHAAATVNRLCTRAVLLEAGRVVLTGSPGDVLDRYQARQAQARKGKDLAARTDRTGDGLIRVEALHWEDAGGREVPFLRGGQDCRLVIGYTSSPQLAPGAGVLVSFGILDLGGQVLVSHRNDFTGRPFTRLPPRGEFVCQIPKLPLTRGDYVVNVTVRSGTGVCDSIVDAARLGVEPGDFFGTGHEGQPGFCKVLMEAEWTCRGPGREPADG